MAREPFDDVTLADVLNYYYAAWDVARASGPATVLAATIEGLLAAGDTIRAQRKARIHWAPKSHPLCGGEGETTHDATQAGCLACFAEADRIGYQEG